MRHESVPGVLALLGFALCACGDDDGGGGTPFPYRPGETAVIDNDGDVTARTPSGNGCVELPSGECVRPQEDCGPGAHADVLLDSEGRPIEVICLPGESEIGIVYVDEGRAVVPSNGAVVILGHEVLGADLTVEGNRAIIYGDSPATTVLDGDLDLRGNESVVRGVTVTGNVEFDGNTAELYYCVILGDVVLEGNQNFISNCTIFGSIRGSGNEDRVLNNLVEGEVTFGGAPDECQDNLRFEDADDDLVLDEAEAEAAVSLDCE